MSTKKPLNTYQKLKLIGPSIASGLLLFLLSLEAQSMCDFPHNPAVLCTTVDVGEILLKSGNECEMKVKVKKLFRPKNVYSYDKSLNRIDHTAETPMKIDKEYKSIFADTQTCLTSTGKKDIVLAVKLNCSDENVNVSDFAWMKIDLKSEVQDPWTKKMVSIDCSFLRF